MKNVIKYLLKNRMALPASDWTVQGFGFLRLRIDENTRMHIWDTALRQPGVSDIHDHTQWAFTSRVISGRIANIRYVLGEQGVPHQMATLRCGIGGGMLEESTQRVNLMPGEPELYLADSSYRQEPDEIHRTNALNGTVTLITQERRQVETARVFWPAGRAWGDAIPRQATPDEVEKIGGYALLVFK